VESTATLIAKLNSNETAVAEEAQLDLQDLGLEAIAPVLNAVPTLGVFGQRCVLDLLESQPVEMLRQVTAPSVAQVVMSLLASEDEVVREWAANVLRHVDARESVPLLRLALERTQKARIPADWTEPVALRRALTALADRKEVVPPLLASTIKIHPSLGRYWPAILIKDLVNALAEASQVLLYFESWRSEEESMFWTKSPTWVVDLRGSWRDVVERAKTSALGAVEGWTPLPGAVVTLEWIAESDI
jgi:hypothetical protein